MHKYSVRTVLLAIATAVAMLLLASCSNTVAAKTGTPEYYWGAAREAYAAGDYGKTVEQLDRLIEARTDYTARAVPWSLVLTSGLAAGYIDVAEAYAKGARLNSANTVAYRRKASEYRNLASPLVLQAARTVEKLDQMAPGSISLVFGRPRGSQAPPAALYKIAAGFTVSPAEAEAAVTHTLDRNVLLAACYAVGAPNDSAKASDILSHASTITPRATFADAMAQVLDKAATLYGREGLDLPDQLALVQARTKTLRAMAEQVGPAMVVKVQGGGQ